VFRGISKISLDAKGRFAVPAKYRPELQDKCANQLVITVDPDQCLLMYPKPRWDEIENQLMTQGNLSKDVRRLQRLIVGYATDCEISAQGKVQLSQPLRDYAGLDKAGMLVGQGQRFEIWDQETWHKLTDDWRRAEQAKESLNENLVDLQL